MAMVEHPSRSRDNTPANPIDESVLDFLRALSKIVRLFSLYPSDHSFVREGVEEALRMYHALSAVSPGLTIAHAEGRLIVEERQISGLPAPVNDVIGMFRHKNIESITLLGQADDSEILSFAQLLGLRKGAEPPLDMKVRSFADLKSIKINEVSYRKIGVGQAVVDKHGISAEPASGPDPNAIVRMLDPSSGGDAAQLLGSIASDPEGVGRAIHSVSARQPSAGDFASNLLENAAKKILDSGGGFQDVMNAVSSMLSGFPADFVRSMTGGAIPAEAPLETTKGFSLHSKGRLIASLETGGAAMAVVTGAVSKLAGEKHERTDIIAAASADLAASRHAFLDAAPYVLDLLEIDRRARRTETEHLAETARSSPRPATKEKLSALVVVDSPVYRQFFSSMLDPARFETTYLENGSEAFDAILEGRPDLVILDPKVPGMHGLDMIRQLRLGNVTPPMLVITEHSHFAQEFEVKAYQGLICLKKPPSKDAAAKAIEQLSGAQAKPRQDEEESAGSKSVPRPFVEYMRGLTRPEFPMVQGYDIAWAVDLGAGADGACIAAFPSPSGRTGILVTTRTGIDTADVSLIGLFQSAVRLVSPFQQGGKLAIVQAAGLLGADRINERPLAVQSLLLEPGSGEIRICTAGAPAPLKFNEPTRKIRKVGSVGVTVGGLLRGGLGRIIEEEKSVMEPGDTLVLSTWGVQRAANSRGEQFGVESIGGLLLTAPDKSPEAVCKRILQGVRKHAGEGGFASGAIVAIRKL